ncbi:PAF acetylhydrolase family protein [Colletotrichum tofieldiae]|nr:PAF acetylhydrolase family protein [Colletotrichum tofieldiae]
MHVHDRVPARGLLAWPGSRPIGVQRPGEVICQLRVYRRRPDHTYDAAVIEFPDGGVAYVQDPTNSDENYVNLLVKTRQEDMTFVIDQFTNSSVTDPLLAGTHAAIDSDRIVAVGHSFGAPLR